LFYGVKANDPQITSLLVAASSQETINAKQNGGDTALTRAVRLGNLNVIDKLLEGNPALEVKDGYGNTALMNAARQGRTQAVLRLLRKGANPNTQDNRGVTARTKAKVGRHRAAQQVLRAAGGRG
jgi:ankyrin repeat protein